MIRRGPQMHRDRIPRGFQTDAVSRESHYKAPQRPTEENGLTILEKQPEDRKSWNGYPINIDQYRRITFNQENSRRPRGEQLLSEIPRINYEDGNQETDEELISRLSEREPFSDLWDSGQIAERPFKLSVSISSFRFALHQIQPRTRKILMLHRVKGWSKTQIAREIKVSRERVRQLIEAGEHKVRKEINRMASAPLAVLAS